MRKVSKVSPWACKFKATYRVTCDDKCSSNGPANRDVVHRRGGKWGLLPFDCGVHITSTIHEKVFGKLFKSDISAVVNMALSLSDATAISRLRACIREEILHRILVKTGVPPRSAMIY